jgi:hypothetical protein
MALYDDFYDALCGYDYDRRTGKQVAQQEADAKLPGIVESIKALPLQITVSDAKAQHLLDLMDHMKIYVGNTRDMIQAGSFIAEVLPHLKVSKKYMDSLLADLLDWALYTKNVALENFCVSHIPVKFSPNKGRTWGLERGFFSFSLFIRAFLNGNEAEKEKYLHESLRQFLETPNYKYIFSIKDRADEVETILKERRPAVYKEVLLEYLKKKKQDELFDLLSNAEFNWVNVEASTVNPKISTGYWNVFTLKLPAVDLEKLTDDKKKHIDSTLVEARVVMGFYPDSINFVLKN